MPKNKLKLFLPALILSAFFSCVLWGQSASAYTPEYYYYHMDSLHDTIQKNGMTGTDGTSRTNLFPVLIDPDPNYKSSKVTLSASEKQWVLTLIARETGACKVGAIIEAQVVRDSYLYLCGLYKNTGMSCPYSTMSGLISHAFSSAYMTTTPASQLGYATEAYNYVFEQGNSFYPMKLFSARGWRLTSGEAGLGYKEAIVMNTHYDNGSTVRWINDSSYTHAVMLTSTHLITGGDKANERNNSVPASSYEDSEPYNQTASSTPSAPSSPSDPSNPGDDEEFDLDVPPEGSCASFLTMFCNSKGTTLKA